jgi:hypothetical protein
MPAGPLSERLAVGVFLCKDVNEGRLRDLDVVLAGNSSVLAEALTAGRPAAYVPGLDHGPSDLHAFVARGLVCQYCDERSLDPDAMQSFYLRPDWSDTLRLFANVCEDEAAVATRAKEALRELTCRPLP